MMVSDDSVLRPDFSFIARVHRRYIRGVIAGPPDLVIEVTSPENWQRDVYDKRDKYEQFGVKEYWVIDIAECRNRAFQWHRKMGLFRGGVVTEPFIQSRVLNGLRLNLRAIWRLSDQYQVMLRAS